MKKVRIKGDKGKARRAREELEMQQQESETDEELRNAILFDRSLSKSKPQITPSRHTRSILASQPSHLDHKSLDLVSLDRPETHESLEGVLEDQ